MAHHHRSLRHRILSETAKETLGALPPILKALPNINARKGFLIRSNELEPLQPLQSEAFKLPSGKAGFVTQVLNDDTLDVAIRLTREKTSPARVLVLNLASDITPGGGWLKGSLAQEESICYRSSLYLGLPKGVYPLPKQSAVYTPDVIIVRDAFGAGHQLIQKEPSELDVISVVSVAAIRRPEVMKAQKVYDGEIAMRETFAREGDRELTKTKMRTILRIAGKYEHTHLVLGALGCGAFKNPTEEIAYCWREVLAEKEFEGGWWEKVVFAVLDKGSDGDNAGRGGEGNFGTFERILGDVEFAAGSVPRKVHEVSTMGSGT
ncbi:uncharacterized protein PV09_04559 [Verruconis gallopava]|uniref:Microbial-type PARG catalytic domain-containing protein n=1 Tax=Verruconis gallopava TaxID=253628 RepID=A0A0D2AYK5_9PEZI|nr:uncharacterized protein PV09_04559 [Verruconis gallopava]KIW04254.1 hypothetical protein PV09_04559 [Verruconis gallopava]